jgi:hypothetical protein
MKRSAGFHLKESALAPAAVRQSRPECSAAAADEEGFEQEDSLTEVALKREINLEPAAGCDGQ